MTPDFSRWREVVARYQAPTIPRSVIQLCNTLGPLLVTFVVMYFTMKVSYFLTLGLAVVAAGFLIRTFIIMASRAAPTHSRAAVMCSRPVS